MTEKNPPTNMDELGDAIDAAFAKTDQTMKILNEVADTYANDQERIKLETNIIDHAVNQQSEQIMTAVDGYIQSQDPKRR